MSGTGKDVVSARQGTIIAGTPAQIEAEIDAARRRLAGHVDEIAEKVSPSKVAERTKTRIREQVYGATHDENGQLDTRKLAIAGGAVAAVFVLFVVGKVRTRSHR